MSLTVRTHTHSKEDPPKFDMGDPFGKKKKDDGKKKDGKKGDDPKNKVKDDYKKPAPMFSYESMAAKAGMDTSKFKKRHPDGSEKKGEKVDEITKAAFGPIEGKTRTVVSSKAIQLVSMF